jgi:phosphatidylglycerophosphate synthase
MSATSTKGHAADREPNFLTARLEKRILRAVAARLPAWIRPDHMTAVGVLAAVGIAAAYGLSNGSSAWLWLASGLLVVQWLGDSLDGTLARVRKIERPRYGYYLDHLVDAFATVAIGVGLGLSPHMLLSVGLGVALVYLLLSINVYLEAQTLGRFGIGYGKLGPTEARLALIAANTAVALGAGLSFELLGVGLSGLDVVGIAAIGVMLAGLIGRAGRNLRALAALEPAPR